MLFSFFNFGGKKRSKLGKLIDRHGYTQEELREASGVSRNTVSKACNESDYVPSPSVMRKLMKAIRELDPGAKADDYFDI
ncbi:helix-turn-helix transcriptional regulator [Heyndrickxia sp. MSNUG]|uniref:helix-turn-helix transcriptional regulator n=1 Tax=Heyndrickxia sp. MSNUG TaxID=3136677 RepID=UPI003C2C07DE